MQRLFSFRYNGEIAFPGMISVAFFHYRWENLHSGIQKILPSFDTVKEIKNLRFSDTGGENLHLETITCHFPLHVWEKTFGAQTWA
jgi:hypothetical protein